MFSRTKLVGKVISPPQRSVTSTGVEATAFKLVACEHTLKAKNSTNSFMKTHCVEFYGDTAAFINNAVVIGSIACVVGCNEIQTFLDQSGKAQCFTIVIGDYFSLLRTPHPHPIEDKDIQLSCDRKNSPIRYPHFVDNIIPHDTFDDDIHCRFSENFISPKERDL